MSVTLKWLGFALVAAGVAVFPFAIWFSGPWGVISLLCVMAVCVLLLLVLKRTRDEEGEKGTQR